MGRDPGTPRRRRRRVRGLLAAAWVAVAAVAGWLTYDLMVAGDWSAAGRHRLSPASAALLERLDQPLYARVFMGEHREARAKVRRVLQRYGAHKADFAVEFIDPRQAPERAGEYDIGPGGGLILEYGERSERLQQINEQTIGNALVRLARQAEPWIAWLQGHGERAARGEANRDLGRWVQELEQRGMRVRSLDPDNAPAVAQNSAVLVVASPRQSLPERHRSVLQAYLAGGGNLLWLRDPEGPPGWDALAETLGVRRTQGVVLSIRSARYGVRNPALIVIDEYPDHPLTRDLEQQSLLPVASPVEVLPASDWRTQMLLRSSADSWSETGPLSQQPLRFDPDSDDRAGPLALAWTLERQVGARAQRVAVTGDGDFLSNAFLDNGANRELGTRLLHWLAGDDRLANIAPVQAPDARLQLSPLTHWLSQWGFALGLPVIFALGAIWSLRRGR